MDPEHVHRPSAAERLLALPLAKREALNALLQRGTTGVPRAARTSAEPREIPMSYGQRRLWFLDQWEHGSAAYNIPAAVPLESPVDLGAIREALREILRRHSALRTVFRMGTAGPVQNIRPAAEPELRVESIDGGSEADQRSQLVELATRETQRPFDLAAGPLFRAVLFLRDRADAVLLMTMHHIVADGWSLGILFHELRVLYAAYRAGAPSPLAPLPLQYSDFAVWQQTTLTEDSVRDQLAYWRAHLANASALQLPTDRPAPVSSTLKGAQHAILAPSRIREKLLQLNRREGVTMNMTLLAAFQVLLHRYSGQDDIVVGLPVAGRHSVGTERLIGFFVNFLVVRTDLSGTPTFRECLHRVRRTALDGFDNQDVPFEWIVSALHPERERGRNPLFRVTFQLFAGAQSANEVSPPLDGSIDIDKGTSLFDLAFNLWETSRGIEGRIEYSTDLFDRDTIARMANHFVVLLDAVAADPDCRIADLPLLTDTERAQILTEWTATAVFNSDQRCIHELVEVQANLHPGKPAVRAGGEVLTFGELNALANRVAHRLINEQIGPEQLVAVCLDRSPRLIATLLGVLKAGAAYVPIDPSYPPERIAFLIRDSGADVVIADSFPDRIAGNDVRVLSVEQAGEGASTNPQVPVRPEQLAYVIYTSGSTGSPKGVEVEHRALRNLVDWHQQAYAVRPEDRATQLASVSFDAAVWEMWPHLAAGASISIPDDETRAEPQRLLEWLAAEGITICFLPTPLAEAVLRLPHPPSLALRELLTGGDRLRCRPRKGLPFRVTNHYGPTENTVIATAGAVEPGATPPLPSIGRPIHNNRVYILDSRQRPVPIGVAGEIYLAGASLARGYHKRPDLSAERFVADPLGGVADGRMYRTGDFARWLNDGTVEFLGRGDRQLKIRGFRIEAGEVETALARHPGIQDAVVAARPDARGEPRLVAYVVQRSDQHIAADVGGVLRDFLLNQLPEHMVPRVFVPLESFPVTQNGKIDLDALPDPDLCGVTLADERPANDVERALAEIWQQVLQVNHVGVHDDFFINHGGHSLLSVALVSRIRDVFQIDIPLRAVFEAPTIRRLALRVQSSPRRAAGAPGVITRRATPDRAACSFAQQRLWFLERLMPGPGLYNIPAAIRLDTRIDPPTLQRSVAALAARHEALRTTLRAVDGEPVQHIVPLSRIQVLVTDLRDVPADRREAEAVRLAALEARRPFVLDGGVLFRVGLLRLAECDHVLLVTMHHIIADGWSIEVFFRELAAVYEAHANGQVPSLTALPIQYGDYAEWQRTVMHGGALQAQLEYWKHRLAGAPPLDLPTDRPRPAMSTYEGGREFIHVDRRVTSLLKEVSHAAGGTLFMTLLAAFQTLLFRYSGQDDVVVGTVNAGRERLETEGLIGLFVNTLALRTDMSGSPTFRALLARVKEVALGAYANAEVPFEKVVEQQQPVRDLSRNPLVQVTFQLFGPPAGEERTATSRHLDVDRGVATFDLSLDMWEIDGGVKGRLEYSVDLFDAGSIARMAAHFQTLLESIVRDPGVSIDRLAVMDAGEEHRQLVEWNDTRREYPREHSVYGLFQAQAQRTPHAVAVRQGVDRITYAQLDRRATVIADHLRGAGVRAEAPVAVCLRRSIDWIAALLGVLKSGGAYLALDPAYPSQRLQSLAVDAGAKYVVTCGPPRWAPPGTTVVDLAALDGARSSTRPRVDDPHDPGRLAYIVYTSGSTGTPKGVMVEHAALLNHTLAVGERYQLKAADRVLQFAPLGFDVAAEEVFPTLAAGATLVLRPDEPLTPPGDLAAYIGAMGITVANLPSAYWHEWVDTLKDTPVPLSLRLLVVGSERVDPVRVGRWLEEVGRRPLLINAYGTSETTISSLCADLSVRSCQSRGEVPVGRPLANVTAYVLDRHMQPAPVGVAGDLHIGGAGVARGYVGADSPAFVPSPFGSGRLYRTGDRARYLPDGGIVLCGRADHQIKIRGFRIEPAEIESTIKQHAAVRDAIVTTCQDERLTAYVIAADHVVPPDLTSFLRERLPEYMVPAFIVPMERFPLTPHGKLDSRALPAPGAPAAGRRLAPQNDLERVIAAVWEEALSIEHAGTDENFFELGGHSLLLLRVHSRLETVLQRDIAIMDLFRYPTIRAIAEYLATHNHDRSDSGSPGRWARPGTAPAHIDGQV